MELIKKLKEAEEEIATTGLTPLAFAAKWWFETQNIEAEKADRIARELHEAFLNYPHWSTSEHQGRELRTKMYKAMIDEGIETDQVVSWAERLLGLLKKAI
jgi:type I restriction enzyme R subunit